MENEDKKVIKATRYEIESQLNNFVGSIKVNGLDKDCKLALVKLKIKLGEIVEEISEFRKKTVEGTIKPEGYDNLKQKVIYNKATNEEKAEFNKIENEYNKELGDILLPYLNETINVEFDGITEDDFWKIVENSEVDIIFGYEYLKKKLVK